MALQELQKYTFVSKYARWLKDKNRRETWKEAVDRVRNMMLEKYKDKGIDDDINWAYDMMFEKKVLGSQRCLQFGGESILKKNCRLYNCSSVYCDRPRVFQEALFILLCGSGIGLSIQKHHVNKLPKLRQYNDNLIVYDYRIPDNIEGWADALGALIYSYFQGFEGNTYSGCKINFIYDDIRPKGSYLSSSSGKAPGPEPLRHALEEIRKLLDRCVQNKQERLRPIDCGDIICHASDAVLSGGVRRSSCILLFSPDDEEMIKSKTGNWFVDNPQRARANNSVVLERDKITFEEFSKIMDSVKMFGEPGFYFVDNTEALTNPCLAAHTTVYTKHGRDIIENIQIGDKIWSKEGWTTVVNKINRGKKDCSIYITPHNDIVCTPEHKIMSYNVKIPVYQAMYIDVFDPEKKTSVPAPVENKYELLEKQTVYDITVDNQSHTFWANGFNVGNCSEIGFYCYDENGNSGWGFCNLSTINCGSIKDEEDFYTRCRAAAILGSLQAGFTDFEYLGKTTEQIVKREALLGVSMTGIMEKTDLIFNANVQRKGARIVRETNKSIAAKIGINPAARTTALKPEGTTSCLLGTSSGVHPHHAKRYLRRVQNNNTEAPYQFFKLYNDHATEKSVWSVSNTDENIIFPIEIPDGSKLKNQVKALDMLEIIKTLQQNWISEGKDIDLCTQPWLSHSVSNTCVVKDDEWDDVIKYVYKNRKHFAGVTFLSDKGDKDYPQAPFTSVLTSHEIVREYGDAAIWCSGLIELALSAFDGNLWDACTFVLNDEGVVDVTTVNGNGKNKKNLMKLAEYLSQASLKTIFKDKFNNYAEKYFEGDLRRLSYCLKDVYNWKLYCDIKRDFKKVDYTNMVEMEDNTKFEQEIACAGGACLI